MEHYVEHPQKELLDILLEQLQKYGPLDEKRAGQLQLLLELESNGSLDSQCSYESLATFDGTLGHLPVNLTNCDAEAAPSAGAAVIMPRAKETLPPPGVDGLRFDSYEDALAATDRLFRTPVKAPVSAAGDDAIQVQEGKRLHVKSLVEALKYDGYRPTPEEWKGKDSQMVPLTQENKADFVEWQEGARTSVRSWMVMPNIDVKLESVAWEIFEEILKVRLAGAKLSKKSKSKSDTCSRLVQEAVDNLRAWANVRLKAFNCDKIADFAANPTGYALTAYTARRGNIKRKIKEEQRKKAEAEANEANRTGGAVETGKAAEKVGAIGATGTGSKKGCRRASENGAIAHQFMPATEARKRKRKTTQDAKAEVDGEQQVQQGAVTAVENTQTMPTQGLPIWAALVDQRGSTFSSMVPSSMSAPGQEPSKYAHNGSTAPPTGIFAHGVSGLAADTDFTFASFIEGNPFITNNIHETTHGSAPSLHDDQMPVVTQHKRRRAENVDHQSRPAVTFDAAVPGTMPPPPIPTQGGMPEGRLSKKRKTGGGPRNEV